MNNQNHNGSSPVWGILAGIVLVVTLIGGSIYAIGSLGVQREQARADQWQSRAQAEASRAYAQVEMARAHEAGSTERMQVFALTLKSLTVERHTEITLLSVGVLLLAILQVVQFLTRPRGGA